MYVCPVLLVDLLLSAPPPLFFTSLFIFSGLSLFSYDFEHVLLVELFLKIMYESDCDSTCESLVDAAIAMCGVPSSSLLNVTLLIV